MLKVNFRKESSLPYKLLFLGAHSDDIEIGCGGSILRFLKDYDDTEVFWVVFSASGERKKEAKEGADLFSAKAKKKTIFIEDFRDSYFPYVGAQIKDRFEKLKVEVSPDIIFTHWRNDLHQDHRLINELTWNTFRDHIILEYEIMKYDGDIGNPNFFIYLDEETCQRKMEYIFESFKTQSHREWFSKDLFFSILRLRGLESNSPYKYAEGFFCRKAVF